MNHKTPKNRDEYHKLINQTKEDLLTHNKDVASCSLCESNSLQHPFLKFVKDDSGNKGSGLCLCHLCIQLLNEAVAPMLSSQDLRVEAPMSQKKPFPKEVYDFLNRHIISQNKAKRQLSIAIAHHYRRIQDPTINKSNVLIMGPTGTGKTEMARKMAEYLEVPFVIADATSLTTRGYIGEDTESIVARLLSSVDYNVKKAERGIIFIDEIDKLARSQNKDSQIATVAVQQELLKIMEGSVVKIKGKDKEEILFNTKNVLFICAGSFDGIEKLSEEKKQNLGFSNRQNNVINMNPASEIDSDELIKFGMIPELMGRIAIITHTEHLNEKDLYKILTEPENSLVKQYTKMMKMDDVEIEFEESFLEAISQEAVKNKLGARGVRKVLEKHLGEIFFHTDEYSGKKIIVGKTISVIDQKNTQIAHS